MPISRIFTSFSSGVAKATGKPVTFALCVLTIAVWALTGPIFHYSDTWQLVINTGTTVVTFLQVFLIQNTQNRDGAALQAKLDELIRASAAQNRYIGIETLTEEELDDLRASCRKRGKVATIDSAKQAGDKAVIASNTKAAQAAKAAIG